MARIRFLGSGNAFCPKGRLHSLVLLDENILVDAPPTVVPQLQAAGMNCADIRHLLITHWHGDHVFGLPFLLLERKYISDREGAKPLEIHLHDGGTSRMKTLCELAYPGSLDPMWEAGTVRFDEVPTGSAGDWTWERLPVCHVPETEPHGYRLVHEDGCRIFHSGDSGPCPTIDAQLAEVDVLIVEMGVPDWVEGPHHHTPARIRELAEQNGGVQILVTHSFTSPIEGEGFALPELPENVIQVRDGDAFRWDGSRLVPDS